MSDRPKQPTTQLEETPEVPNYRLCCQVGRGSFGEVWMAENLAGALNAVKIVKRSSFEHEGAYDREFNGIRNFEPISRKHQGFVPVLHLGRGAQDRYFYYVMELADDLVHGRHFDPAAYRPHTLGMELRQRARLPLRQCVTIGLQVAGALGHLHELGYLHRDIKPSNIVVIDGYPRLADVGLVTRIGEAAAPIGTLGYMPEEGQGERSADLYALGKMLYELSTGKDRQLYPELPTEADPEIDLEAAQRFNAMLLKACEEDPAARFQNAIEMFEALSRVFKPEEPDSSGVRKWLKIFWGETKPMEPSEQGPLDPIGGAVPLESRFYVVRAADHVFHRSIAQRDGIVRVKGARQMGKTSLLARGLQQARSEGLPVVLIDLQEFNDAQLASSEMFYQELSVCFAEQLGLDNDLSRDWNRDLSPNKNLERFMRRQVLATVESSLIWALDEVDRLFPVPIKDDFFGLLRAWYNKRALDPAGPWRKLTVAMAYATEVELFIKNLFQSPFNVGTRLTLDDFTAEQVEELDLKYGQPLRSAKAAGRFMELLGGQPYLTRRGLHELAVKRQGFDQFALEAEHADGIFADHLQRLLASLSPEPALREAARRVLEGGACQSSEAFLKLRSAGILTGESPANARFRCQLYERYLRRTLL